MSNKNQSGPDTATALAQKFLSEMGGKAAFLEKLAKVKKKAPSAEEYTAIIKSERPKIDKLFAAKIIESPSAYKAAIDHVSDLIADGVPAKHLPTYEKMVVGDEVVERRRQADRARAPKAAKGQDALALLIHEGMSKGIEPAKKLWDWIIRRSDDSEKLERGPDDIWIAVCDSNGHLLRRVKRTSFDTIVSRLRKIISDQI